MHSQARDVQFAPVLQADLQRYALTPVSITGMGDGEIEEGGLHPDGKGGVVAVGIAAAVTGLGGGYEGCAAVYGKSALQYQLLSRGKVFCG